MVETVDPSPEESSDSSISEDEECSRIRALTIFRQQLIATDSKLDRASGRRKPVVDHLMKSGKTLAHTKCLLCETKFTLKKSLYRHYRKLKPCQERQNEKPKKNIKKITTKENMGNIKFISML